METLGQKHQLTHGTATNEHVSTGSHALVETLGQKRRRFTRELADLISYLNAQGFETQLEEVLRRKVVAEQNAKTGAGIANSLHLIGLAADLSLFVGGVYQSDSSAYKQAGLYWESKGPDYAWGGRFSKPDGNHFSISHEGVK